MKLIDKYLKFTRRFYTHENDDFLDVLSNLASSKDFDMNIVIIKSNLLKNEIVITEDGITLVWDLEYWKHYTNHIYSLLCIDIIHTEERDDLLIDMHVSAIDANFYNMLSKRCRFNNPCFSLLLAKESLRRDYGIYINKEKEFNDINKISTILFVSKIYVTLHEVAHILLKTNESIKNENYDEIYKVAKILYENDNFNDPYLKPKVPPEFISFLRQMGMNDEADNEQNFFDKELDKNALLAIIQGKNENLVNELASDIIAFKETLSWFKQQLQLNDTQLLAHVSLIRSAIHNIKFFNNCSNAINTRTFTLEKKMTKIFYQYTVRKNVLDSYVRHNLYNFFEVYSLTSLFGHMEPNIVAEFIVADCPPSPEIMNKHIIPDLGFTINTGIASVYAKAQNLKITLNEENIHLVIELLLSEG